MVELSRGEYALAIMILTKKDIFGNWIEHYMCGDYRLVKTNPFIQICHFLTLDALGYAKVFNRLDSRFGYHLLPLTKGDKVKTTFWGMDFHGEDCLYQWFLPFGLINVLGNFKKSWIECWWVLAKCYIDDIKVFSLILRDHMHHL